MKWLSGCVNQVSSEKKEVLLFLVHCVIGEVSGWWLGKVCGEMVEWLG